MLPVISNCEARRIFLSRQQLCASPTVKLGNAELLDLIQRLGFVQVDSINTVQRAHQMILFSRNQTYRPAQLKTLLESERCLFENWTHDAAIIPSNLYRFWRHRFARERKRLLSRWSKSRRPGFKDALDETLKRVHESGELRSRDTHDGHHRAGSTHKSDGWWDWHPSKTALEFLWRTGELAVARREGFQKIYDLSERVLPAEILQHSPADDAATLEWACSSALEKLGFATSGELAAYWDAVSPAAAKSWAHSALKRSVCEEVLVENANGTPPRKVLAYPSLLDLIANLPRPPTRLRLLSPFDPVLRDRARCERLFGFRYRIEVFVPAGKRRFGYYVFPMLEGDRFVGRIDLKCHRDQETLKVQGLWWEPGVRVGRARKQRLDSELQRLARFVGAKRIDWDAKTASSSC